MTKEKFILAAGSPVVSRQLAAIFQNEGWQVRTIDNDEASRRFLIEEQNAPQYLVIDKVVDWTIQLAREYQPHGTRVILSEFRSETPEEVERMLGVPYDGITGLPSKVATVLLGKRIDGPDIDGSRFPVHNAEIQMMDGSLFDKALQKQLGLDGLVIFHRDGFNPMNVFTTDYLKNPNPELVDRTAVWTLDRDPNEMMVKQKLAELLSEVSDKGGRVIGISQIDFRDRDGVIIDDRRADEMLLRIVSAYMRDLGALLPIEKIYILIDERCKPVSSRAR